MNLEIIKKLGDMVSGDLKDDKLASRSYKSVTGRSLRIDFGNEFSQTRAMEKASVLDSANRGAELFRKNLEQHYGIPLSDAEEKAMSNILLDALQNKLDATSFIAKVRELTKEKRYR